MRIPLRVSPRRLVAAVGGHHHKQGRVVWLQRGTRIGGWRPANEQQPRRSLAEPHFTTDSSPGYSVGADGASNRSVTLVITINVEAGRTQRRKPIAYALVRSRSANERASGSTKDIVWSHPRVAGQTHGKGVSLHQKFTLVESSVADQAGAR